MAPFTQNMGEVVPLVASSSGISVTNGQSYSAHIDKDWMVGIVPNGGYLLGLVLQACNLTQKETKLQDPLYLSAQFLGSSTDGPCTLIVKRVKDGKNYANLTAELIQDGRSNIHCQLIYGVVSVAKHPFGPFPTAPGYLTHAHPSPLSRRCPLSTHPSKCHTDSFTRPYTFDKYVIQALDLFYLNQMDALSRGEQVEHTPDFGGGGFIWAGWVEMVDEGDSITPQMIPLLADLAPDLVPQSLVSKREPMWFPTLALSADFKHRLPSPSNPYPGIAPRTVGVFVTTKLLIEGRHESVAEIWTAPSGIGQGEEEDGWRDKMFCLAVVTQTALTVPATVNSGKAKGKPRL